MKVLYIGSLNSKILGRNDCLYVPANLILFAEVENISESGFYAVMSTHLDIWEETSVIYSTFYVFEPEHALIGLAKTLKDALKDYHKAVKIKNKVVENMRFISSYKTSYAALKLEVRRKLDWMIEVAHVKPLIDFIDDKTWEASSYDFTMDKHKQSPYIPEIVYSLTERKHVLSLDFCMEEHFSFTPISLIKPDDAFTDFIKIPVWKLPLLRDMTHAQLKYTRQDLQPALVEFQKELVELSDELNKLSYTKDNLEQIQQLCNEKLLHHIEPIQKTIDESLYICQQKNNHPSEHGIFFTIGITSASTIVNYFDKSGIVVPYVANEIKEQVKRHIDLNTAFIFTYYTANPSPIKT